MFLEVQLSQTFLKEVNLSVVKDDMAAIPQSLYEAMKN